MAKENNKVMAAKPAKAAPAAKPQKTSNPESLFNRFAKPVGKLGLVGAITAGSIGFVNELTKDQIATNWYEFALSSYMEMGDSIQGWERNETEENFNIISEGTSGSVTEYMVYCSDSIAAECTAESTDKKGIAFKAEANHGGYGNMIFQVAVSLATPTPTMVAYNQLGFVTSFAKQTGIILNDLDKMIADNTELQVDAFISGASTSVTTGGINSMLGDMRTTYDLVASDPIDVVKGHVSDLTSKGNIDKDALLLLIDSSTEVNPTYNEDKAKWSAKLSDGSYLVMYGYEQDHSNADVLFHIQSDGLFTWAVRSGGFVSNSGYEEQAVIDKLNEGETTPLDQIDHAISGGSANSTTNTGGRIMIFNMKVIWADKGGFA